MKAMVIIMNYHGITIYRERKRRNWSQEGLCKGICTVSYLSKIENGKAEPSEDIVQMLLERLGLHTDPELEAEAARSAESLYELLFTGYSEEFKEVITRQMVERYRATAAGADFLLLERFVKDYSPLDADLEVCLDTRQLALQRRLQGRFDEAIALLPNAFFYWSAGLYAYNIGDHTPALEYLQMGYDLAAKEGALKLMLDCKVLIGNTYCNRRDIQRVLQHYTVAKRIATALNEKEIIEKLDYNTAAVQIENGQFEEGYVYFSKLSAPNVMSLHKLAICCEKTGRRDEALAALDKADKMESEYPEAELSKLICAVVRYRLEHADHLEREEYGRLLLFCFERCRKELPMGYAYFHLPWVIEWFKAARQYKKVLELIVNFPDMSTLM